MLLQKVHIYKKQTVYFDRYFLGTLNKWTIAFIIEYQISMKGRWKANFNAGGWLECPTFYENPQYIITIHPDSKLLFVSDNRQACRYRMLF